MSFEFRKPGVYVDESLLIGSGDIANANTAALFVGLSPKGPVDKPVYINNWSEFVTHFGGFNLKSGTHPTNDTEMKSYLPYAVYSYFQNGGRPAWIMRSTKEDTGAAAFVDITAAKKTISSVSVTSNVATVTTSAAHGLINGQNVVISGITGADSGFNGVYEIESVPTSTTFTVAFTHADGALTITGTPRAAGVKFRIESKSVGVSDNGTGTSPNYKGLHIALADTGEDTEGNTVYTLGVFHNGVQVERFSHLTTTGEVPGTRAFDSAVNDTFTGSRYVQVTQLSSLAVDPDATLFADLTPLASGEDPDAPLDSGDLTASAVLAAGQITGPLMVNIVGFLTDKDDLSTWTIDSNVNSSTFPDRNDIFVIFDGFSPRGVTQPSAYVSTLQIEAPTAGDSYVAAYAPWIIVPNPQNQGTIAIPPGGAVAGVVSRVDSTVGVFRSPAGVIAGISNALSVDTKFTDAELGELNSSNINILRPMAGVGVAVMGARTRKLYGADRYVSARRTLIYLKETFRKSTEYALFENNDHRLWSRLTVTADRILRPLWEAGGLRGKSSSDAYFIRCDESINTPQVIQSGEVRMEIGVALEYPAEFIIIHITQFERGAASVEVLPN